MPTEPSSQNTSQNTNLPKDEKINPYTTNLLFFVNGFYDAINIADVFYVFTKSRRLKKLFVKTFLLNGGIFLSSVIVLDYIGKQIASNDEKFSSTSVLIFSSLKDVSDLIRN